MKKKMKFFKPLKQVKKDVGNTVLASGVTGITFLGAKAGTNYLKEKITNETAKKIIGPAKMVAGMALEAFAANPIIAGVGRGLATSGFDTTASDLIPEEMQIKMKLKPATPVMGTDDKEEVDWEKVAREEIVRENEARRNADNENGEPAPAEQPVNGVEELATNALL